MPSGMLPNRHGQACPGRPWREPVTTDGRDMPGRDGGPDVGHRDFS